MNMVFLWFALGWVAGMATALVIGWRASKRAAENLRCKHDKEGDQDSNLFV